MLQVAHEEPLAYGQLIIDSSDPEESTGLELNGASEYVPTPSSPQSREDDGNASAGSHSKTRAGEDDIDESALAPGGVDVFAPENRLWRFGYLAQYFAVGILYAGLPATCYGFFLGYLSVPAHTYSTVVVMTSLPWSFKLFFGMLNDTLPIRGQRRKPYMILGWSMCAFFLIFLAMQPLPPPYWCIGADGRYIKEDGLHVAAKPCHPESATAGGGYALLMILAATGYVIADVAADGLTVEYARSEPLARRGNTQTTAYLTRSLGQAVASVLVGFGMNSHLYNGSFERGLSFSGVMGLFAVPALAMVPITALLVREPVATRRHRSLREYLSTCWVLLRGGAFFSVVCFSFFTPVVGGISTTAGGLVKAYWAKVESLQNQLFSLLGHLLFAAGLWLVKRKGLHVSWRLMLACTTLFLNSVDLVFVGLTTFGVVRNQYFYLGETVLYEVPAAAQFVVSTYVIVEMSDEGVEGLVYGLLTTAHNLATPFARAIGNQIYRLFTPSLSDAKNYIEDSGTFRQTVFQSFLLSFAFATASLAFLRLLPDQKGEAQQWKRTLPKRDWHGVATIALLATALCYSLLVNFLSMHPRTMCLKFAGGKGCAP